MTRRTFGIEDQPVVSDASFRAVFDSALDAYLLLAPDAPRFTMLAANEARLRATMTRLEDVSEETRHHQHRVEAELLGRRCPGSVVPDPHPDRRTRQLAPAPTRTVYSIENTRSTCASARSSAT